MLLSLVPFPHAMLTGALAGLSIAVPIGPMGLLCIQRSLRFGFLTGFATGLGGVAVNAAYAAILLLGLHAAVPAMDNGGRILGALGGLFLLWSAVRVIEARAGLGVHGDVPPPQGPGLGWCRAFLTGLGFNATNPLLLVLILAALGPVVNDATLHPAGSAALLAGLVLAASAWWAGVSVVASVLRGRIGPSVLLATNRVAGVLLSVYGSAALLRAWTP